MPYDQSVPNALLVCQEWFGKVIARPLGTQPTTLVQEANAWITSSPLLLPHERVTIYNQQYWWRLLNTLHEFFPLVVRLFGYTAFNQTLAIPYITDCRPNHWSLNQLGDRFLPWVEKTYQEKDRQLVLNASRLDDVFNVGFFAGHMTPLGLEGALEKKVSLQPHVRLFSLPYHLFRFREELVEKEPEYWEEHDFPDMEKGEFFFVVYRNRRNYVCYLEISQVEWAVLSCFEKETTIADVCDWAAQQPFAKTVEKELQEWFQKWTAMELLR